MRAAGGARVGRIGRTGPGVGGLLATAALFGALIGPIAIAAPAGARPRSDSPTQAGYNGPLPATSSVSDSIIVPKIDCTPSAPAVLFFETVINGTATVGGAFANSGADLILTCSGTTAKYSVVAITEGLNGSTMKIHPGDTVTVSVSVGPSLESIAVNDATTGHHIADHGGAGLSAENVQLTAQGGFGSGGFPPFTRVVYRSIVVNGAPLAATTPESFNEVDAAGKLELKASALEVSGSQFTVRYIRNT